MAKPVIVRVGLNLKKPWNNSFFDPISRVHLTLESPVGKILQVTPAIIKGLTGKVPTLLDLDRMIDLEGKCFKDIEVKEVEIQEVEPVPEPIITIIKKEEAVLILPEEPVEEVPEAVEPVEAVEAVEPVEEVEAVEVKTEVKKTIKPKAYVPKSKKRRN